MPIGRSFSKGLNERRDHTEVALTKINLVSIWARLKQGKSGKLNPIFNARYHRVEFISQCIFILK